MTRDQIPAALIGAVPAAVAAYLPADVLAYGPFAVEVGRDVRVAYLLRPREDGLLSYENADRAWYFRPVGAPIVRGNALALRDGDTGQAFVIRPLRDADAAFVLLEEDGRGGTLAAKIRRSLGWE